MRCGREPGGRRVDDLGECPAATATAYDGINGGTNAGRYCWAVSGTMCHGHVQGHFVRKLGNCVHCRFFQEVSAEEDQRFVFSAKPARE